MNNLLNTKETAARLRVHSQTVYKWKDQGKISYIKLGRRIYYEESGINAFIEKNKVKCFDPCELVLKLEINLDDYDRLYLKGGKSALSKNSRRWNYGIGTIYTRETKQRKKRWYIDFKANGRRVRQVIKNAQTRAQAVLALQEKVNEVFSKEHNPFLAKKKVVFCDLADMYLSDYAKVNKESWRSDQYRIEAHMKFFFGDLKLQDITPLLIEKYRSERLKTGVTKSTVNREITIMKKMFNLAVDWNLMDRNPALKVKLFSEKDTQKERILTEEEEVKLEAESPDYLKPILIMALHTGMRRGEILNLRWRQVDLGRRNIKVENTKSGKNRLIPINDLLFQELLKVKGLNGKSEHVFPNPKTGRPFTEAKKSFKGACKRAAIDGLRFHDLRHTFATRLIESGTDLITVRDLLGHHSVKVTQRYTHSNQDLKKAAVELLAKRSLRKAENHEDLSRGCHISENEKDEKSVSRSYLIH
jgi:excisionase family DNA binding protein